MKKFVLEFTKLSLGYNADLFDTGSCSFEQRERLECDCLYLPKARAERGCFVKDEGGEIPSGVTHVAEFDEIDGGAEAAMRALGFRTCDVCGAWVSPQDVRNGVSIFDREEGKRYCRDCLMARDAVPTLKVNPYHSSVFTVKNAEGESFTYANLTDGIGLELECEAAQNPVRNGRIKATDAFFADANPRKAPENRCWHVEGDCTVHYELISDTMTEKFFRSYDLRRVTDQLSFSKNDESIDGVGFHIHLSKGYLGATTEEQLKNFNKVLRFVNMYQDDFQAFSHRKSGMDMYYCSWMSLEAIKLNARRALLDGSWEPYSLRHGDNGCAIINSNQTVEFRFFHSTNDPERVRYIVLFLIGLCRGLSATNEKKIFSLSKAFRKMDADVVAYLRKNGLFLHTKANEQRGIED